MFLPVLFNKLGDYIANFTIHCAWLAYGYGLLQAFIGFSNKESTGLGNFSNQVGLIKVNVESILEDSDV
jgi:hypothetical protein